MHFFAQKLIHKVLSAEFFLHLESLPACMMQLISLAFDLNLLKNDDFQPYDRVVTLNLVLKVNTSSRAVTQRLVR